MLPASPDPVPLAETVAPALQSDGSLRRNGDIPAVLTPSGKGGDAATLHRQASGGHVNAAPLILDGRRLRPHVSHVRRNVRIEQFDGATGFQFDFSAESIAIGVSRHIGPLQMDRGCGRKRSSLWDRDTFPGNTDHACAAAAGTPAGNDHTRWVGWVENSWSIKGASCLILGRVFSSSACNSMRLPIPATLGGSDNSTAGDVQMFRG